MNNGAKVGIGVAALALVGAGVWGVGTLAAPSPDQSSHVITVSNLEKIIDLSELSTSTSVYNGIAEVPNLKDPEKIDCYVAYEAKVQAGIDFSAIDIDIDEEHKLVRITLPQVHLQEADVDITSLDYIFVDDRANTATVSERAYKACQEDVNGESQRQEEILELARQNAENTITALIEPFIQQADAAYIVEFM